MTKSKVIHWDAEENGEPTCIMSSGFTTTEELEVTCKLCIRKLEEESEFQSQFFEEHV